MKKTAFYKKIGRLLSAFSIVMGLTVAMASGAQPAGTESPDRNTTVTIEMNDATVAQVIKEIENQTRFVFLYTDIDITRKISVSVRNLDIKAALESIFADTDIAWKINGSQIILSRKEAAKPVTLTGTVRDESGVPVIGAAVFVKGSSVGAVTDTDGRYSLQLPPWRSRCRLK